MNIADVIIPKQLIPIFGLDLERDHEPETYHPIHLHDQQKIHKDMIKALHYFSGSQFSVLVILILRLLRRLSGALKHVLSKQKKIQCQFTRCSILPFKRYKLLF